MKEERINLDLCLDPQFGMIRHLFKQVCLNLSYLLVYISFALVLYLKFQQQSLSAFSQFSEIIKFRNLLFSCIIKFTPCEYIPSTSVLSNEALQVEARHGNSIYDETRPEIWLDLYGDEMPTKVEAWTVGPAELRPHFDSSVPTPCPPELDNLSLPEFKFDFSKSESIDDVENSDEN